MKKHIGLLAALLLAVTLAAGGSAAETAPDLSEATAFIGVATHWNFVEDPYEGVENPEMSVNVTILHPPYNCIVPIPEGFETAAEVFGKGLRFWVDAETMDNLRDPSIGTPVVLQPLAVAFAGESASGTITAFGEDFVELSVVYSTEGKAGESHRFAITGDTVGSFPLYEGAFCDVVYDAEGVALFVMIGHG